MLESPSATQIAPFAPRPVGQVATRAVIFDLFDRRTPRITSSSEGLRLHVELLLDVNLFGVAVVVVVEVRYGSPRLPFNPGRGGGQSTACTGSYGYLAQGRLLTAYARGSCR